MYFFPKYLMRPRTVVRSLPVSRPRTAGGFVPRPTPTRRCTRSGCARRQRKWRLCDVEGCEWGHRWWSDKSSSCDRILQWIMSGKSCSGGIRDIIRLLQKWSIPNLSCSLTKNVTSHSIKNLAFHRLLRWKMIILPILTTLLIHFF